MYFVHFSFREKPILVSTFSEMIIGTGEQLNVLHSRIGQMQVQKYKIQRTKPNKTHYFLQK